MKRPGGRHHVQLVADREFLEGVRGERAALDQADADPQGPGLVRGSGGAGAQIEYVRRISSPSREAAHGEVLARVRGGRSSRSSGGTAKVTRHRVVGEPFDRR